MDDNRIYNTISQLTNEKIDPEIEKKWRDKLIAEIRPNYVITGHNHIATIEKNSSYTLLNPGSICKPKDHEKGSYMIGEYNHNKNDWEFKIKRIII
jgi:predicted phosphodiesterase